MYCPTRQGPVSSHRQAGPGDPEKNENRRRNPTAILTSLIKNPTLKCSADFSAKPLFCPDQTLLIAQVGLGHFFCGRSREECRTGGKRAFRMACYFRT